jgi:hypothetical protein
VEAGGKHIQVKAHAKAGSNSAQYSAVSNKSTETIDELIIVVFTEDYKLKSFYKVPWREALKHIHPRGKAQRPELNWRAVEQFKQEIGGLLKQEIVQLFT